MKPYVEKVKSLFGKTGRIEEKKPSRNPYRDWAIMFGLSVVSCILLAGAALYIFLEVKNGTLLGETTLKRQPTQKKIDEKNLVNIVDVFKKRAEEYETFKSEKVQIADPSL